MNDASITDRLEFAISAGTDAGRLTLEYFNRPGLEVERKADLSPVTIADRQAEQLLRQRIAAAFPDDGILGEEFGEHQGQSGFRWILDPIDGTKTFVHGVPMYGTMIGVEFDGRSVVGLVYVPPLDEVVYAAKGQGAFHRLGAAPPRRCRVSTRNNLAESLLLTTAVSSFGPRRPAFETLESRFWLTRTWGDCYGYLLVATGRAECMIDPIMNVWDAAALQPILEEAGGTFTDWQGRPTIHSGEGIATNGLVLEEVLQVTRATG